MSPHDVNEHGNGRNSPDTKLKANGNEEREQEKGDRSATQTMSSSTEAVIVDWDGPNDPQNPRKYVDFLDT
jgi:hypothetical protein